MRVHPFIHELIFHLFALKLHVVIVSSGNTLDTYSVYSCGVLKFRIVILCLWSLFFLIDNVATLFRGTSAATSLMDQYMKMVAVPYVQSTLRDTVVRIMECKHSCEVRVSILIITSRLLFIQKDYPQDRKEKLPLPIKPLRHYGLQTSSYSNGSNDVWNFRIVAIYIQDV